MALNVPAVGNGYFAVLTTPGATVYFYATNNFGMTDVMPSANSWTPLNGTLSSDGSGVVADSTGIAAIQAPWITNGNISVGVAFGGLGMCGLGVCLAGQVAAITINKRGFRGGLGRFGRLNPVIKLAGGSTQTDMWPGPGGYSYHGGASGGPDRHGTPHFHGGAVGGGNHRQRFLHTAPKAPQIVDWG